VSRTENKYAVHLSTGYPDAVLVISARRTSWLYLSSQDTGEVTKEASGSQSITPHTPLTFCRVRLLTQMMMMIIQKGKIHEGIERW